MYKNVILMKDVENPKLKDTGLTGKYYDIWGKVFDSAKDKGYDEETAAKIAWGAVKRAGYTPENKSQLKSTIGLYFSEFKPTIVTLKGNKHYYIEGYISTIDEDLEHQVITRKAQEDMYKQVLGKTITFDVEHSVYRDGKGNIVETPRGEFSVGKIIDAKLTPKGLWVKGELNQDAPKFENIWKSIQNGFLHAFSIAFYPVDVINEKVNGTWKSFVEKLNLTNIALTGAPVNPNATFEPVMKAMLDNYNKNRGGNMITTKLKGSDVAAPEEIAKEYEALSDYEKGYIDGILDNITGNKDDTETTEPEATEVTETPEVTENAVPEDEPKKDEVSEVTDNEKPKLELSEKAKKILSILTKSCSGSVKKKSIDENKNITELKSIITNQETKITELLNRINKLESQPIKKAMEKQDASKVLAKTDEIDYSKMSLIDLIK